ncbi:MAG TPA: hypothetical protein V6D19_06575 [Stenomitos sp.]
MIYCEKPSEQIDEALEVIEACIFALESVETADRFANILQKAKWSIEDALKRMQEPK